MLLGPGDDAAVVAVRTGPRGHDDRRARRGASLPPDWAEAADIGARAAAQSLSDVNAMGGRTTALTVGLAVPAETPLAWVTGLADGLAEEAALVGATVVGGDLTRADSVVISVTAIGEVRRRAGDPQRRPPR